jgi:amidophosphoribosyltransferase
VFSQKAAELLRGSVGIGHVRYPTTGGGGEENAQPFLLSHPFGLALAHNGNLTNYFDLRTELEGPGRRVISSSCDAEIILNVLAEEMVRRIPGEFAIDGFFASVEATLRRLKGAYSVVGLVAGRGMFMFRDPYGIKPIMLGERIDSDGTAFCAASESVVLDMLDFHRVSNVAPGEAVFIDMEGNVTRRRLTDKPHRPCIFEYVYFARPDSFLDKISVHKTRMRAGQKLAEAWRKTGIVADVIIPIPESATTAAMAMSRELGVKYREGFVKNRYIGRTFIMPNDRMRQTSIRAKLNPIQIEFEGKDVLLVDDSIVRGNTSKQIVSLARQSGARKVYFASYSPPLRYPCVYGIDMSTRREFVAKNRTPEEVAAIVGADYVLYQTLEDLESATREGNSEVQDFCNACFSGNYPTSDVTGQMLEAIETDRMKEHARGL